MVSMETEKDNSEEDVPFRIMVRWPTQPEGSKERSVYWQNLLAAVRASYVEWDGDVWCDLAPVPNMNAGQQAKYNLTHTYREELPPGEWKFRCRTREDGRVVLQGRYRWHENWNALRPVPGFHPMEHKFFRRFREATGSREAYLQVYLDWVAWTATLNHPVSPLDSIGIERLPSPSD